MRLPQRLLLTGALLINGLTTAAVVAQERELGPDVRMHAAFQSKSLSKPRDIIVWLPPGYDTDGETRYPVLYMHDGANVYVEWRIDEIAKQLITSKQIAPMIMVFVPNGGELQDRFEDYTWTKPANVQIRGQSERVRADVGRGAETVHRQDV
jgi:enterochelin esterase-like enzyme